MAKLKLALAVLVFSGVVGYLIVSGMQETTVYYYTVEEVLAGKIEQPDRGIRLAGNVVAGSVKNGPGETRTDFMLAGQSGPETIHVQYQGLLPDNFKEGMPVVVEGLYKPASHEFTANSILLKCPSKYEKAVQKEPA